MLNSDNFFNYARKHYDNPSCRTAEEFTRDLRKFGHLRTLLKRVTSGEEVNFRLILNQIMILFNIFTQHECIVMIFFKLDKEHHSIIKTFLVGINLMPDEIPELNIISSNIRINEDVAKFMRGI